MDEYTWTERTMLQVRFVEQDLLNLDKVRIINYFIWCKMINNEDQILLNTVAEKSRCVLQWWFDFTYNIQKQGWISPKQRKKLQSFNYKKAISKVYGTKCKKKAFHWTEGMDHDDMTEYSSGPMY